ncbi:MAG: universal stress protein [Gaiellaceae bacterium]
MRLIVVGVDGSPAAKAAACEAIELAAATGASLTVVAAYTTPSVRPGPFFTVPPQEPADAAAREAAADVLALAEAAGVDATAEVIEGSAASEILHVSELREADLIVVGSRGLGALSSAFVGSVSRGLLSHAHIPVLVVKDRTPVATALP